MSKTAGEIKVKKFLNKYGVGHLTKDLPSGHNVMNLIIEYSSELEKEINELREFEKSLIEIMKLEYPTTTFELIDFRERVTEIINKHN